MREPFRPRANTGGAAERPADALATAFLGRTQPARDWQAPPQELPAEPEMPAMPRQAPEVSLSELAQAHGGTAGLARHLGISQRQAERYLAGRADPARSRRATRQRLQTAREQLAQQRLQDQRRDARRQRRTIRDAQREERRQRGQAEWGAVVERLGGIDATAKALGRHRRTVERWLAGQRHPSEVDRYRLSQVDRHVRVRQAFRLRTPEAEPSGGGGGGPQGVFMRASGRVVVEGYYRYDRQIGVQGELGPEGRHPLPPEVAGQLLDHLGRGDNAAALQTLEEHLSTGYAQCDGYDPDPNGEGWHFQTLDEFDLVQLDDDGEYSLLGGDQL